MEYTVLNPGVVTEIGGQKVIVVDLVKSPLKIVKKSRS